MIVLVLQYLRERHFSGIPSLAKKLTV